VIAGIEPLSTDHRRASGAFVLDIVDESIGSEGHTSPAAIGNEGFRCFVSETIAAFGESGFGASPSYATAIGSARAMLVFRRSPLVTSGDDPFPAPPEPAPASSAAGRVVTPWFNFSVTGDPPCIDGVFHWSERAVLRDQAILAGIAVDDAAAPTPLPRSEFERLADDFATGRSSDAPPELTWLFHQSPRNRRGRFSDVVVDQMHRLSTGAADRYARLAGILAARCIAGGGATISIADIRAARSVPE
jgi:hypothetical protein